MVFAILPALAASPPTFYRDIQPILREHCQNCHRPGEIGPMALQTYQQVRPWSRAIKQQTALRAMPPWFADPRFGHFSNDPSLTKDQIATIAAWVDAGSPAGVGHESKGPEHARSAADLTIRMPNPVSIPASGDVEYTYEIVPTGFTEDRWVQMSEIRPSSRAHVHHAVVYVRPPGSKWLERQPAGRPFTVARDLSWTTADILLVYAPGSSPDHWPPGMAKLIPRGSDLVFQMHYTTNGKAATDQTIIALTFAKEPVKQRVLTLQLTNDRFVIPPGVPDYRVEVSGTLPNDCTLLSFFPHMHLRGKQFEYNIVRPKGRETLLRVNYNFYWQLSYRLAQRLVLKAGTKLEAVAVFDNSRNNPHNPDPEEAVRWGDQTDDEMMVGFFDVAVPAEMDKTQFFVRGR
jgi:hypothetical protein